METLQHRGHVSAGDWCAHRHLRRPWCSSPLWLSTSDCAANVQEALQQALAKAAAQAGAPFQAAMAQVDPALAGQLVQLGLG